jgi:protocatechuate 3,4-dioxygenase alpha subunit
MSERQPLIATSSQTVGPFFHFGLTTDEKLGIIAAPGVAGEHMLLRVSVRDGAGDPVPDAVVELYQADAEGRYPDRPDPSAMSERQPAPPFDSAAPRSGPFAAARRARESNGESHLATLFTGFGRLPTGADGCCVFHTVRPGPVRANAMEQAPHINVCLLARGLLRQIYTRIYFKDDPSLVTDPLLALVPRERRATLMAAPSGAEPGVWEFVIRLQGSGETVFFDL